MNGARSEEVHAPQSLANRYAPRQPGGFGVAIGQRGIADLLIIEADAIALLPTGSATARDVWFLRRMVNHARTMALAGIGPEVLPACDAAQPSIQKIEHRATGFYLADVGALAELHRWHQVQREESTTADYLRAVHAAARRDTLGACPR